MSDFNVNNYLKVKGAREHNLKNIDIQIPLNKLVSIIGVSGSGKSSLIYDIIANESIKHFNYHITSSKTQYNQRIESADFDEIQGLPPGITIGQNKRTSSIYSTLGTLSDLSDYLRIAFARFADDGIKRSKSLFSYHSPIGQCSNCKGLGKEEFISKEMLLNDKSLSIAEGLIKTTLPNGYIMYSQLRMEELEKVCQANGFSTTTPWEQLSNEQQAIIWNGSKEVTVTFGKHTLESRLKWKNLKAKPPEEGYYKGMIPVMEDILRRDRNPSILKYTDNRSCSECNGIGLKESARKARFKGLSWQELQSLTLHNLKSKLLSFDSDSEFIQSFIKRVELLISLGFGDYSLNYKSVGFDSGEVQRIKLSKTLNSNLSNVLYVFDEALIGVPSRTKAFLIEKFKELVNKGNSVVIIEHDLSILEEADHIVEMGPKAGSEGGEIVFEGNYIEFKKGKEKTFSQSENQLLKTKSSYKGEIGNVKLGDFQLKEKKFNAITGKPSLEKKLLIEKLKSIDSEIIFVNDSPIGKTSRSTPATYTGIADDIRNLYAELETSKTFGLSKKHFSFNTKEGACETCQGSGKQTLGFSFMGQFEKTCPSCDGKRFNLISLKPLLNNQNIYEKLENPIKELIKNIYLNNKTTSKLKILANLGLGYLSLNQSSNSLSGGEAQRIKLARHLIKKDLKNKWLLLENPSNGLHYKNLRELISTLEGLLPQTKGIIFIDHHPIILEKSTVIQNISLNTISNVIEIDETPKRSSTLSRNKQIELAGVSTKNIYKQSYSFEKNLIHGITGPAGSGKSALLHDTLYQIARNESIQHLSNYDKSFIELNTDYQIESYSGIGPALYISNQSIENSSLSNISSLLDINKKLRFLYSRFSESTGKKLSASHFSKHHLKGKCESCNGKTTRKITDSHKVIDYNKKILDTNKSHNSFLSYYTLAKGQFTAVFKHICSSNDWDYNLAFKDYTKEQMNCYLHGTGGQIWELDWEYETKSKKGVERLKMPWKGICNYIEDDFAYGQNNKTIHKISEYLKEVSCETCSGSGLNTLARITVIKGLSIDQLENLSITAVHKWLNEGNKAFIDLSENVRSFINPILEGLISLDLGHLQLNRLSHSLSGGELQRLKIADKISSPLTGLTYIIEEISSSLPKEKRKRVANLLKKLKEKGNTVFIIDKDVDILEACDTLVELDSSGTPNTISLQSIVPKDNRIKTNSTPSNAIEFKEFSKHGIKLPEKTISLGGITCITGPSGIGKTTLLRSIYQQIKEGNTNFRNFNIQKPYTNLEYFKTVKDSNTILSSYFEIDKEIIRLFCKQLNIKQKDVTKTKQNSCIECKGSGSLEIALDIESNQKEECITCQGSGYKTEALSYTLGNFNIKELLSLSITELTKLLKKLNLPANKKLNELSINLEAFQLNHLPLNLSFKELSSGERFKTSWIKVTSVLNPNTLIFMDEPSKNLYYSDMSQLLDSIKKLNLDVLMVEHSAYLIDRCNFEVSLV